jgi:acyl carrier protein phosphodiesterase
LNYLAHIYLSENDKLITLGNFMADEIKGKTYNIYTARIKTGILLHRQIDSFTDNDITARKSKRRLNTQYGHYCGIIIDIFYDHFLAKNWNRYSEIELSNFVQQFYDLLEDQHKILPKNIRKITPYLIRDNWLESYASIEGIEKVLIGMNRRTGMLSHMNLAINDLNEHYDEFEEDFILFFEKLKVFSHKTLRSLKEKYQIS